MPLSHLDMLNNSFYDYKTAERFLEHDTMECLVSLVDDYERMNFFGRVIAGQVRQIWYGVAKTVVQDRNSKKFLALHNLGFLQDLEDRLVFISRGRYMCNGDTREDIKEQMTQIVPKQQVRDKLYRDGRIFTIE